MGTPYEDEEYSYRIANIFAEGHEIHDKYQTNFWEMGILDGRWECRGCGHLWWERSPDYCPECKAGKWSINYAEVPIHIPELWVRGHADGIVHGEDGERMLIEIKTIGLRSVELEAPALYAKFKNGEVDLGGLWASIKTPFAVHMRQGQMYLHGCSVTPGLEDITKIVFIYEFKANQDVKGWAVEYRPNALKHIIPGAKAVAAAMRGETMTVRHPNWAGEEVTRCRKCPFYEVCNP